MALSASQRLGPYELLTPLGSGGMGEVWRARDERLGREVAVKVLPDEVASDASRLKRFEKEARAASALNHPNIITIYDIGSANAVSWIAMERVEGKTLRELLFAGPLSTKRLLAIATQIANGLATAHEAGIVHRDLKPENVMVTKEGLVKILDFGLAKRFERSLDATGREQAAAAGHPMARNELTSLPTETETSPGVVLGTVGYMSPEQAAGQPVDFRSDQFSFGSMLYEMASGKRAFQKGTAVDTLSAILHEEPKPLVEMAPETPATLRWIVERCLAKEPDRRYAATRDMARDLEILRDRTAEAVAAAGRGVRRRMWAGLAIAAIAIGLATLFVAGYLQRASIKPRSVRFEIAAPPDVVSDDMPRISPDGRYLAFNGTDSSGRSQIWLRPLNALSAQPLPGTEGARRPFWSPDSRFLGFFAGGTLMKIAISGGPPRKICDFRLGADGTWSLEGVILFDAPQSPIQRVPADGGTPVAALKADASRNERQVAWPEFLPDGRHFLYCAFAGNRGENTYRIGSLDSNETRPLMPAGPAGSFVAYAPPGYLLFVREKTLVAQRFDPKALKTIGEPAPVAEQIGTFHQGWRGGYTRFSVSREGTLTYRTGELAASRLVWRDRSGKEIEAAGDPVEGSDPALSPRGDRLAFSGHLGFNASSIWIRDLARGVNSRLTSGTLGESSPVWSPDGSRVVYHIVGRQDLFEKSAAGDEEPRLLLKAAEGADITYAGDWSRDGRYIAYSQRCAETGVDIWVLPTFGDRKPIPLVKTSFAERKPVFSPDGKYVAYESDESGRLEIYVRTFPGQEGKWRVSSEGGGTPQWRADGKELFYLGPGEENLMAVEVSTREGFHAEIPQPLFAARVSDAITRNKYVPSADGQRFLLQTWRPEPVKPITIVLNWPADLFR
jgi:eukaryotic-like serine/threonine-protein kinase